MQPLEKNQSLFALGAALDRRCQQRPGDTGFAAIESSHAGLDKLIAFALSFGNGTAGAIDVGLGAGVAAIEEEHPRPNADRELVLAGEIVVETGEEKAFDPRVSFALRHVSKFGEVIRPHRVGHRIGALTLGKFISENKFRRIMEPLDLRRQTKTLLRTAPT